MRPHRIDLRSAIAHGAVAVAALTVTVSLCASTAMAEFGLKDFNVSFVNQDGSTATQAGSHPFAMKTDVDFNLTGSEIGEVPDQAVKDLVVNLPAGFAGSPYAVPMCSSADFIKRFDGGPSCPASTAVGVTLVKVSLGSQAPSTFKVAVYNVAPPPGVAAKLGFAVLNLPVVVELGVKSDAPYNVVASSTNISQALRFYGIELTVWGDPASPAHDGERGPCATAGGSCPVGIAEKPYLTLPTSCAGALVSSFEVDPWQQPGAAVRGEAQAHESSAPFGPLGMTGCGQLAFKPTIKAQPTAQAAESPTGLEFALDVDDEGLTSPTGISQSDIEKAVVALPEGMTVNPALAEGVGVCGEADLARETIGAPPGAGCPSESKIGTVEVETPLLAQTLKGTLFLAKPFENPFGSLLALYVVVKNPETGIFFKLPGKVEPNPTTGRLVSVFDNLPQLPFSHFRLSFRQGQRSPLVTPPVCGTYTTQAELTPWANPGTVLHDSSTFQVTTGVAGGPCPAGGVLPFKPGSIAGTLSNSAGSYSPLDIRITRNDGEQEITGFTSLLPAGLTANLSGVPFCSEVQIASAKAKTGAQEEAEPSCPAASEIGHTLVGVGVGSVLAYAPGKLYMAGPYEGAPFSVVAITSAKVGPFDLGTVVVHLPLLIDPSTAQVSIPAGAADQIPHIVKGIVVHVRDIRVYVDRPNFTKNPTNCNSLTFSAGVIGSGQDFVNSNDDTTSSVNDPFQASNCANLSFKPSFSVATSGKTSKANGAGLAVKLAFPNAPQGTQSNIRTVKVELPKQLPSRLTTLQKACTAAQFHTNPAGCPAASVVGHAKAITPILPVPIEGPVYFVSNGGEAFPNLIMVLQGYGVTIDLVGSTFISKTGITSSTFKTVPDQPVTSFELVLPQGPYSALTANGNLCTSKLAMPTEIVGQNGALITQTTRVAVTGCPKTKTFIRAQKLALALKACHKKHGAKRKACERQARKKYGPVGKKAKKAQKKG